MICSKCGVPNDNSASYCAECGASLSVYDFGSNGKSSDLTDSSKAVLAIKEAKRLDVSNMRPITRVAYNIESGGRNSVASLFVTLLFGASCVGIIACIIAIFETFSLLSQAATSAGVSGSLSELYKQDTTNTSTLLWLTIILIVLILTFVVTGKLVLRMKKLRRKLGKSALDNF